MNFKFAAAVFFAGMATESFLVCILQKLNLITVNPTQQLLAAITLIAIAWIVKKCS